MKSYPLRKSSVAHHFGFTLIELLVVIAIISILAAILFPVFASAREKARQTTCASNEKQMGLAFLQYVQDFDEIWPIGTIATGTDPYDAEARGWAGQIYPYVKAKAAFTCPDDPTVAPGTNVPISFAYNNHLGHNMQSYGGQLIPRPIMTLAKMAAPSSTVLLCELQNSFSDPSLANENLSCGSYGTGASFGNPLATGVFPYQSFTVIGANGGIVHVTGSNFLACDGHVKFLGPTKISGGFGEEAAQTPTCAPQNNAAYAACTSNLTGAGGQVYTLTFSPF